MWQHIAHSVRGPGHLSDGSQCQDNHCVRLFQKGAVNTLVACVADGAGSAKFSHIGSKIACDAVMELAAEHFEVHDGVDSEVALGWCQEARSRIRDAASLREQNVRHFASTLCVAVVGPEQSFFFQIGDGAIILGRGGVYGVVFWPQSGEYANTTNFLTADDFADHLEHLSFAGGFTDLAMMTDGLERLALRFDGRTPHAPFFQPLFEAVRSTEDVSQLSEQLHLFLQSDSVQDRSDDDKTLIIAARPAE